MNHLADEALAFNHRVNFLVATLLCVIALTGPSWAWANHDTIPVLQGKTPVMMTVCNKDGNPGKGDADDKVCYLFMKDPSDAEKGVVYWVALVENDMVTAVFERTVGKDDVKLVWKTGWRSM